jgi:hypothetical protein
MNKTLHKTNNKKSLKFHSSFLHPANDDEQLAELMPSMKGYLDEAARDTISPRPQAVSQLLRKAGV